MAHEQMTKARSRLLLDNPFFGTLALRLKIIEDNTIPTGATDGVRLLFNRKWFEKQRTHEQVGFVAHEVMHIAFYYF